MGKDRGRRRSAWLSAAPIALLAARAVAQEGAVPPDAGQIQALAPYLARIVRLAAFDPITAASLVPDAWIDSLVTGALAVEAEVAARPARPDPPRSWPIGPWAGPGSLVDTIESVDPAAVAALYRASAPRIFSRCRQRRVSPPACERAIRVVGVRLSERSVLERAAGKASPPITPTQRELARLGAPVVAALRERILSAGAAAWGPSWQVAEPRPR